MMCTVVDFHSHVLPQIDDGSASVEESVAMLQMEAEQGIRHVIATPHFYASHDNLDKFIERRTHAEYRLRSVMADYAGLPELHVAAEVHFFTGISNTKAITDLVIDSTKYILIEMPPPPWTDEMYQELGRIHAKQGLTPIIAHVDRYISRLRTFKIPQRLAQLPVLVQANAEFFLDKRTSAMALRMLREENIHILGSDCHNLRSRKPNLGGAIKLIEQRLGSDAIARINSFEQSVLQNRELCIPHTFV